MKIILQRPDGSKYSVDPGANHPSDHIAVGVEQDNVDPRAAAEDAATMTMLAEIEHELGADKGTSGDWIKWFAAPVSWAIGKEDCLSCEFRRVVFNAGQKLRALYGPAEGKKKMRELITRSFREDAADLGRELKELLESKNG